MKKIFFALGLLSLIGCSSSNQNDNQNSLATDTTTSTKNVGIEKNMPITEAIVFETFTDSLSKNKKDIECYSHVRIDFPTKGNKILINNICKWIEDFCGEPIKNQSPKQYVATLAKKNFVEPEIEEEYFGGFEHEIEIVLRQDTTNYVTIGAMAYDYEGGAHGMHHSEAATFLKSNGMLFTANMIASKNKLELRRLIHKHIFDYFNIDPNTDDIEEYIFPESLEPVGDEKLVKLPENFNPYINSFGEVVVQYTLYEIGAYACGEIQSCIPLEEIKPLLSDDGLKFYE